MAGATGCGTELDRADTVRPPLSIRQPRAANGFARLCVRIIRLKERKDQRRGRVALASSRQFRQHPAGSPRSHELQGGSAAFSAPSTRSEIVVKVVLGADLPPQREDVRRHDVRIKADEVALALPEVARVAEQVVR